MSVATDQARVVDGVKAEQWTRICRRMVMIREFEYGSLVMRTLP